MHKKSELKGSDFFALFFTNLKIEEFKDLKIGGSQKRESSK